MSRAISVFIALLSISIYLHPLTLSPTPSISRSTTPFNLITHPKPQLDEAHILSSQNHDVSPPLNSSQRQWMEAWSNDYWGRPLKGESSHKSWRPVSVWSFRFGKGQSWVCRLLFGVVGRLIGCIVEALFRLVGINYNDNNNGSGGEKEDLAKLFASVLQREEVLGTSELFVHRFVNVLIHLALVQLVGVVAQILFDTTTCIATKDGKDTTSNEQQQQRLQQYTKHIAQILFALHPTHVEAVANIANRPHLLALLFNVTIIDPSTPFVAVGVLSVAGLLSAETGIFQYPAVVLMMSVVQFRRELVLALEKKRIEEVQDSSSNTTAKSDHQQQQTSTFQILLKTFITLLPRYILLIMTSTSYLLYRYTNGSLTIPDGLIRPAENPFYNKIDNGQWSFQHRFINYSYILSIHIMKSFGVEMIGFSHEYGFDCISEIELPIVRRTSSSLWTMDLRVLLPCGLVVFLVGWIVWSWFGWEGLWRRSKGVGESEKESQQQQQHERVQRMLLVLTFFAWLATLFPIAGFLKVGTFVADRLVVASTFGTCIFAGRLIAVWITTDDDDDSSNGKRRPSLAIHPKTIAKHTVLLYLCFNHLAKQTHNRTSDWMDEFSLMNSSLKTCPRSIKSNLEASKLYSGLVPQMVDFDKALSLIQNAQSIDPTYCDVHMQYAHVYFQQEKYIPFEEELVEALLCQFTMGQAMNNWNRYWQVMLSTGDNEAKERYTNYMQRLQREIEKAEKEDESKARKQNGHDDEILY